jgi:hypothetical protein
MRIYYYHYATNRIVYQYEMDILDKDFFIPGCRIALSNKNQIVDTTKFSNVWLGNIQFGTERLSSENIQTLSFLNHKCAAMHDIVRICSAIELDIKLNNVIIHNHNERLTSLSEWTEKLTSKAISEKYDSYFKRIYEAKTTDEVKTIFKDFWISTKHVDSLDYNILNLNI